MNAKRRSLGKGLEALLSPSHDRSADKSDESSDSLREMPIDLLTPGEFQPRTDMNQDKLQELAESIKSQGIVQPIVIRPLDKNRYEIIAGERRWRAAQLASLNTVPVIIKHVDDNATIAIALIENIQREDLNPLEESSALQRLINEFDLTHQQAADAVGRSRAAVSNLLRLQELEPAVKKLLAEKQLEMGHARALLTLRGEEQAHASRIVLTRGLSVRETEKLVQTWNQPKKNQTTTADTGHNDPDILKLENDLTEKLGAKVQIKHSTKGKGQMIINYAGADELEGILDRII